MFGSMASAAPAARGGKGAKAKQATEDATYYVAVANLMAVGMLQDPKAAISPAEKDMIVPGLADILQKSEGIARLGTFINPIALVVGVGLWGSRCFVVWREKHPPKAKPGKQEATPAQAAPAPTAAPDMAPPIEPGMPNWEAAAPDWAFNNQPVILPLDY